MPKKPGDPNTLYIDGKEVPAAQNVEEVVFSPDGKRYMAICSNRATRAKYVVLDGKKGPEYQTIDRALLSFSLDSYRAIYVGNDMGKSVVVVDGQPSASYAFLMGQRKKIVLSQRGGHYAYVWSDGSPLGQTLVIDGKPIPMSGKGLVLETLSLYADGSRHAFVATRSGQAQRRLARAGRPARRA